MIEDEAPLAVTGIVVTEILQGLFRDASSVEHFLAKFGILEPLGFSTYSEAAAIFRKADARGIVLATIDALIAAIALEHGATILTLDKDFSHIARITNLQLHKAADSRPS